MTVIHRSRKSAVAALIVTLLALAGCSAAPAPAPAPSVAARTLTGMVAPVASGVDASGWTVTAWNTSPDGSRGLGTATTDATGAFTLSINQTDVEGIVWVDARPAGENRALLGTIASPEASVVTLNERTTVAAGYALAQFFGEAVPTGRMLWVTNAAAMAANLADPVTGGYGQVLTSSPNGTQTSALATFTSLTAMLSACLQDDAACDTLFSAAAHDRDRLVTAGAAFAGIARDPSAASQTLFTLSKRGLGSAQGLPATPSAWTIALRFGGGDGMTAPGNLVVDPDGHVWASTAYHGLAGSAAVCSSARAVEFGPGGAVLTTLTSATSTASGYGIEFDRTGRLWLSDRIADTDCAPAGASSDDGLTLFRQKASVLPPGGVLGAPLQSPQGIELDRDGKMWVASCGDDSVRVYPTTQAAADSAKTRRLTGLRVRSPFAVVDNGRHVFITGNSSSTVAVVERDGTPLAVSPLRSGFDHPLGIASDDDGNVWVANSGQADLPCGPGATAGLSGGSVTHISPDGDTVSDAFTGGGLAMPWGITTDGDGNVWVANAAAGRITEFCGATASTCPRDLQTGEPISPDGTGYSFDGLSGSTGIAIDLAGNVWVTDNGANAAGALGHDVVVFVGAAAPAYIAPFQTAGG